jgi:hypothetical protein
MRLDMIGNLLEKGLVRKGESRVEITDNFVPLLVIESG